MMTGIILFFILAFLSVPVFTLIKNKYYAHSWIISTIYVIFIIVLAILITFLPILISHYIVIGDAKSIYVYDESGTLYYDSDENIYFYSEVSEWEYPHMVNRVNIEYELGKNIHSAAHLIENSEYIFNSMIE